MMKLLSTSIEEEPIEQLREQNDILKEQNEKLAQIPLYVEQIAKYGVPRP